MTDGQAGTLESGPAKRTRIGGNTSPSKASYYIQAASPTADVQSRVLKQGDTFAVFDHYGDIIVRARIDGTYDKTNLPDELVLTSYFGICDDKITNLTIIANQPSPY